MSSWLSRHTPKLIVCLREGYTRQQCFGDLSGGLTTAIISLPLAMALGIASIPEDVAEQMRLVHPWLTPPAMGLFTAVIGGFLISGLGGSRVQIGGPTAAFIPIIFGIAASYGYEGLMTATAMAGVILVLMGLFRFGQLVKYIPYPVTTGFTSGIAVTILVSQIKDFFGMSLHDEMGQPVALPAELIPKVQLLAGNISTINVYAAGVGVGSLVMLIALRRVMPRIPGAIVAVVVSSIIVSAMGWNDVGLTADGLQTAPLVETIGTRFGGIPDCLPPPRLPAFSFDLMRELIPAAMTIAVLSAIESLLSAVVADGMTGGRHRSDQELLAQGVANVASAMCFGLPATGAIARTAANIKSGGTTPLSGIVSATIILVFMLALAPLAKSIPLSALAAVLILVAWNICEIDHFRSLLRAPRPDVLTLLTTFGLTVFTDLVLGVGVGMIMASFLFMSRMAETSTIVGIRNRRGFDQEFDQEPATPDPKDPATLSDMDIPPEIEVYEINGPFFFGVADRLSDILRQFKAPPKVFILRMRYVPHIDATAMHALEEFFDKCRRQHTTLLLGGVHIQPLFELTRSGLLDKIGNDHVFENLDGALTYARVMVSGSPLAGQ
ncbi:SulP family inorganic anion transporter [Novipirellula artificiosorum]|uniref:C4-dicarboxylic acid transporter DauA n=1 Tax=Novipirellula artificiosorum TaxID=2528016 RepID=A0A5C6CZG1_9BACT|nr:SulP family inorganic anion transporter [Novipirellula artificiosorum]TWU28944.1 C4-dicarboxylic acid transporter DauA [Novipirellula artificiosorum]